MFCLSFPSSNKECFWLKSLAVSLLGGILSGKEELVSKGAYSSVITGNSLWLFTDCQQQGQGLAPFLMLPPNKNNRKSQKQVERIQGNCIALLTEQHLGQGEKSHC